MPQIVSLMLTLIKPQQRSVEYENMAETPPMTFCRAKRTGTTW
jgi:hypothetical protein